MMETLNRLMDFHGKGAKGIVWEHNTHIGDARATNMSRSRMVNIGPLGRIWTGKCLSRRICYASWHRDSR
jgi:erythromycin esterase-like protein